MVDSAELVAVEDSELVVDSVVVDSVEVDSVEVDSAEVDSVEVVLAEVDERVALVLVVATVELAVELGSVVPATGNI